MPMLTFLQLQFGQDADSEYVGNIEINIAVLSSRPSTGDSKDCTVNSLSSIFIASEPATFVYKESPRESESVVQ